MIEDDLLRSDAETSIDPDGEQIDGLISQVDEPRTVRVGLKYNFQSKRP